MDARISPSHEHPLSRREILGASAALGALGLLARPSSAIAQLATGWDQSQVAHLIPTASHERFLIKTSFRSPLTDAPQLTVDGRAIDGVRTDPQGRFWRFDATGLRPATRYELRIVARGGAPLCEAWPLKTFPAPTADPERVRILAYTCGGGYDSAPFQGKTFFLDMAARRRLLARGLSYQPDVVVANGDQIYWDQLTALNKPMATFLKDVVWPKFGPPLDHIVQSGALGTGDLAFPSAVRSIQPGASQMVTMDETLKPTEKNGFTVIDVTRDKMTSTHFMWRPPQAIAEIDTMPPARVYEVARKP